MKDAVVQLVVEAVKRVAARDSAGLEKLFRAGVRCELVFAALDEYGMTFVEPAPGYEDSILIYPYEDGTGMGVQAPLVTVEEGVSDLELTIEVKWNGGQLLAELYGVRVP